jgi:glycosyltransferase involved in cell wall biosynthesis
VRHHLVVGAESDLELARRQTGAERVDRLPSLVRQVDPRRDLAALAALRRRLRAGGYAAVVSHQSKAGVLVRLLANASWAPPAVHSLSMASFGPGYGRLENWLFPRIERALGGRAAAYCVVGGDLAGRFAAIGVPAERMHVVRSGIPLPGALPDREEARRRLDRRYGTTPGRPLVCYVGSLEERKNTLLLPSLLRLLHQRLTSPPQLLVVGDGPDRERLVAELAASGLAGSATLTGYLADPALVHEALRGADVSVLLSAAEGLPQVLVQSAATGTPFVAFDVEGVRELIALGAEGSAVPVGDVGAAAAAVADWLAAPTGREPRADLSSWSPEAIEAAYRGVLDRVLGVAVPVPREVPSRPAG